MNMNYFDIKNLKDLETLVDKLVYYISAPDLSINEIKEKSRIITMFTYFSRYTISFSTLLELYSENKEKALHYVLDKLNLQNKESLIEEFNQKYKNNDKIDDDKVNDIKTDIEKKEVETILNNDANITEIIKEVENEVKHISVKKLDEDELEEMKKFSVITDEERNYIRGIAIENKRIVKIISGGKTFEIKENNDVITIKIPSKTKLIIDKNVVFDYENETNDIFQKNNEESDIDIEETKILDENTYTDKENIEQQETMVVKKKRGRKPKNSGNTDSNIDSKNETIKRILDI